MKISLQGKQPKVVIPPFYPDQAKPYLSESEAQSLFQRVDEIFHKTGSPPCPLVIMASFLLPLFCCLVPVNISLLSKRKREITEVIEQWNRTEGFPKGIYFALGSDHGTSPDDFWNGLYPRAIGAGNNVHNSTGQSEILLTSSNNQSNMKLRIRLFTNFLNKVYKSGESSGIVVLELVIFDPVSKIQF